MQVTTIGLDPLTDRRLHRNRCEVGQERFSGSRDNPRRRGRLQSTFVTGAVVAVLL